MALAPDPQILVGPMKPTRPAALEATVQYQVIQTMPPANKERNLAMSSSPRLGMSRSYEIRSIVNNGKIVGR